MSKVHTLLPLWSPLCAMVLAGAAPAQESTAYDTGFEQADLVAIVELLEDQKSVQESSVSLSNFVLIKSIKGRQPGKTIAIASFPNLGLHVQCPKKKGRYLLFLKKLPMGYLPLQKHGLTREIGKNPYLDRAVLRLLGFLRRLEDAKKLRAAGRRQVLARDLFRFVQASAKQAPDLANSAMLVLARRAWLVRTLDSRERKALVDILMDGTAAPKLRELSSSCLAHAGHKGLAALYREILSNGKAKGIAASIGRALRSSQGRDCIGFLKSLVFTVAKNSRADVLAAMQATGYPTLSSWLRARRNDQELGPDIRRLLGSAQK